MKLEALMLRSLCAASMLVCALVLGAMLTATPATASVGLSTMPVSSALCQLPPDAVVCPLAEG